MFAARAGDLTHMKLLLEADVDLDACDESGRTALVYAAADNVNLAGRTALVYAAADNAKLACFQLLLEAGAGMDAKIVSLLTDKGCLTQVRLAPLKKALLRRAWVSSGRMYRCYQEDSVVAPVKTNSELRTGLRTRRFFEELMQVCWRPGGRLATYFREVDDDI